MGSVLKHSPSLVLQRLFWLGTLLWAGLTTFPAARSQSQVTFQVLQEGVQLPPGFDLSSMMNPAGTPAGPQADQDQAKGEDKPDPRKQRLSALTYDRRPSVILKAWSTPPPEPEPVETEADDTSSADTPSSTTPSSTTPKSEDALHEDTASTASSDSTGSMAEGVDETASGEEEPGQGEEDAAGSADSKSDPELTEEERAAAEAAAEAEAAAKEAEEKAKREAAAKEAEKKAIDAEMEKLQRNVTLGAWDAVRDYLHSIDSEAAKAGYQQLLTSLNSGPPPQPGQFQRWAEKNAFGAQDVIGLAAAAPETPTLEEFKLLGSILRQALEAGTLVEEVTAAFRSRLKDEDPPLRHQGIARVLFAAGRPLEAGEFLPPLEKALAGDKRPILNLIARFELARHEEDPSTASLRAAWEATQAVLAEGEVEEEVKTEALERAVQLAPEVREELGATWLEESFTERPQRGMEILAVVGSKASNGLFAQARQPEQRLKSLELQTTAANALVARAPELADQWRLTLELLAANWLEEAEYSYANDSSSSLSPMMQQDQWGNVFYMNWGSYNRNNRNNPNMPQAIPTGDLLDIRPSDAWLAMLDQSIRPKYSMIAAQLLLKVSEESEAFPYIEALAVDYPERAEELVNEFLRVWTDNHNPNSRRGRTNQYMYMYGYNQRAGAIPLTRSKQERNLKELSQWVARLRALPIDGVDEELLANAFTKAHSAVEVYRIETIERVFGSLEDLDPEVLAALVQRMRSNLAQVWRDPAAQKKAGTKRRKQDIQNEVLRGYEVARKVIADALEGHPDEWHLVLAQAAVMHDENNYAQELEKSPEFSARRSEAFERFQLAASLYRAGAADRPEDEETADPYTTWFYATLGACDLNAIQAEMQTARGQIDAIRQELLLLGGERTERHLGKFANALFTRVSNVNPAVKFRYIRSGLEIAGEHELAEDSRELLDFYDDLVTEIRLDVHVDGETRVGGDEPFGLYVDLRHTREIEREAGGFGKYLINQNNQSYGFNYGRPTENYREKFEETAREALQEHFDVQSVTFNHPEAHSIALEEYGWRKTPYAYILLKPRGPGIDRIPALRMDLDFLDTSGYVVLPIESPPLAIDATQPASRTPACRELQITQTIDERQASEGKLILEIRAQALGRIPVMDELVRLEPEGFLIDSLEDQGLSIVKFDDEGDGTTIRSERIWVANLVARDDLSALPETFAFAVPLLEDVSEEYQRYSDADLVQVEREIDLEYSWGEVAGPNWLLRTFGLAALVGLGWFGFRRLAVTRQHSSKSARFHVPETITPFTVIGLLSAIEADGGLSEGERSDLRREIDALQKHFFEHSLGPDPDLQTLASTWTRRAS